MDRQQCIVRPPERRLHTYTQNDSILNSFFTKPHPCRDWNFSTVYKTKLARRTSFIV